MKRKEYCTKELKNRELATTIVELFENLLERKNITIPCDDLEEQATRFDDGNAAKIYGMEYWELIDNIENILILRDNDVIRDEEYDNEVER